MTSCIFCDIVGRRAPASIVHEDALTLAFMNQRQINPGHVLVIPKQHIVTVDALPAEIAAVLFQAAVQVARAIQTTFAPPGLTLWQSNGAVAGQEIPHVHLHLLPRWEKDGAVTFYAQMPPVEPRAALDHLAAQLRQSLEATQ